MKFIYDTIPGDRPDNTRTQICHIRYTDLKCTLREVLILKEKFSGRTHKWEELSREYKIIEVNDLKNMGADNTGKKGDTK